MPHDYQRALKLAIERCPEARAELEALAAWLPHALAQRGADRELLDADSDEAKSPVRFVVRIERRGIRLLDVDNGAGGCKALLDAIRYAGLIPDDDPETIRFEFRQRKVKRKDIGTEIFIQAF